MKTLLTSIPDQAPNNAIEFEAVPHLTTALNGPLLSLESHFLEHQSHIEAWFRQQWHITPPPFYASVDLRNSGFKLAPVDTNLFPAGFNNLSLSLLPLSIQAVQVAVDRICPDALGLLIIPENHTRNPYYLESLVTLQAIITKAGYEVHIGSLALEGDETQSIELPSGRRLKLEPIQRHEDKLRTPDFNPCAILLNNDLMSGRPDILEDLKQPIIPPLASGWGQRLKSEHFTIYDDVASEFAKAVEIDPWLINPIFRNCGKINFKARSGENCLVDNVESALKTIREKYRQYDIDKPPFVIVKADAGTYGMGIMTVHSGEEVLQLNRKQRNKMSSSKGGQEVHQVIIQEGVYTFETLGETEDKPGSVAEPVVYMIDQYVVGGFYRVHTQRGPNENLNAPGMHFEPLAFHNTCNNPDLGQDPDAEPNRFYAYGVIARLALLAAAREIDLIRRSESAPQKAAPDTRETV